MATRLGDLVIVPSVFTAQVILDILDKSAFVQSGVMIRDPELDAFLSSAIGGRTIRPRYMGPLADDEENISSDDPAVKSSPKKITGLENIAVRQSLNQSWSSMDLAATYSGRDPISAIRSQISEYWRRRMQHRLLASLRGVIADNVANDDSDMVNDISAGTNGAELFGPDAFIDTQHTMGDRHNELSAVACHSVVYSTMRKKNLIDFIPDARGEVNIPTYMGVRVIVDDGMTVAAGGNYYTYLFGPGVVALGIGQPKVPFEVERQPDAGNGGGQETVYSRVEWIIHPQGWEYGQTSTPTLAQLIAAENWNRAFERKRVKIACLISKG